MKKQTRKPMVLAAALILGMTVFAPIQAGAAEAVKEEVYEMELEQQQIKGKVMFHFDYELHMIGEDGKQYRISLHDFTDEQIEGMGLEEDADIVVKGTILESEAFFNSFEAYKRLLPEDITEEDLAKIEGLYKELKEVEKGFNPEVDEEAEAGEEGREAKKLDEEKWTCMLGIGTISCVTSNLDEEDRDEYEKIWDAYVKIGDEIYDILEPYLPEEDPATFEEYMSFFGDALQEEVSAEELEELQALYEEYLKLREKNEDDLAFEKLDEFHDILNPYMNNHSVQSFEEFLEMIELDISDEDKKTLEKLYEDVRAAEEAAENEEDWDLVHEKWQLVYEMLDPYYLEEFVSRPFSEVVADFEFEISEEDLTDLASIFEEIKELVVNKNYDAADEIRSDFYDILSPYFEDSDQKTPFKAQHIEINGKEFKVGAEQMKRRKRLKK
ncbi:hypothetical protein [Bacillus chungangensis]|uniref:Uncharacterized protein n=1 Tax=Bacillus chungangensis TaxID=587633 RepID=A0ABT9WUK0_9BACI|nr:hypothetical protein [Bacillus chungangensis]MDQ0176981.1 hypothetical protein [Bacillus chungangensis]